MHLVVEQPMRIDEERVVLARNARADVIGGHFRHAVQIDQAIACGEIDAFSPFRPADLVADGLALAKGLDGHELARLMWRCLSPTRRIHALPDPRDLPRTLLPRPCE